MTFWQPEQSATDPNHFSLKATQPACVGPPDRQFFMGGVAMAAVVEAMEQVTGKPLLWATIQFLSHGMLGDEIDISVEPLSGGRTVSQVAAKVTKGDIQLQYISAALGGRDGFPEMVFAKMPDVPPPMDCPAKEADAFAQPGNLIDQFEKTHRSPGR